MNFYSFLKNTFTITAFLLVTSDCLAQTDVTSFENVNVIPIHRDTLLTNQRVIIIDGIIDAIESVSSKPSIAIHHKINGTGKFLIPGLVDIHFHNETEVENEFKLLIAHGVTTARNMAERPGQGQVAVREQANSGKILAPHYYTAGPYLYPEDIQSAENAVEVVSEHRERGYDYLKIGGQFSEDIYLKVLAEAARQNVEVVGHAQARLPLDYSLRMKSVAHVEEFMENFTEEELADTTFLKKAAKQIKTSGVYTSPTLRKFSVIQNYVVKEKFDQFKSQPELKYLPVSYKTLFTSNKALYRRSDWLMSPEGKRWLEEMLQWQINFTGMLHEVGVPLMAGSDATGLEVNGLGLHRELMMLKEVGLSNYEILKTATIIPARYLGKIATSGSIDAGKSADLVLLNKNPLDDIENTQAIEGVMLKGEWLDRKKLDGLLNEVEMSVQNSTISFDIHPMNGTFLKGKPITVISFASTEDLRYTTDGTVPTQSSPPMPSEITVNRPGELRVKAITHSEQYQEMMVGQFNAGKMLAAYPKPENITAGGLKYSYYEGDWTQIPAFEGLTPKKTGIVDRDFEMQLPYVSNFAYLIEGHLEIQKKGYYTFLLNSDDGSRLYLGEQLLINHDGVHGMEKIQSYIIPLEAGFYPIRLEYFQKDRGRALFFEYVTPDSNGFEVEPIPLKLLYHSK